MALDASKEIRLIRRALFLASANRAYPLFVYWAACFSLLLAACERVAERGVLHVVAPSAGSYEIYAIAGDATLQYVSEQVGQYNVDLPLNPGTYLILADCSHQMVDINANTTTRLLAHSVQFIPPISPSADDIFSIQCSRYEKSNLR